MEEATLTPAPPAVSLSSYIRAMRLFALPASVLPVLVATAVVAPPARWKWDVLLISMLGSGLLNAAGNLFNDYFDFASGVDRHVEGDESRPGRVLVRRLMTPRQVIIEGLLVMLVVAGCTGYLVWRCGPEILWFGGAAAVAVYTYTGPPLELKYKALGELVIFIVFGLLLVNGAAFAQTGRLELVPLLVSVPIGLATTAILTGGNIRDTDEDRQANIRTIVNYLGPRHSRSFTSRLSPAPLSAFPHWPSRDLPPCPSRPHRSRWS